MTLLRITSVVPLDPGFLSLTWNDGISREVDVSDWMTRHPVLEALRSPEIFRDVSVVDGGGGIEWANGADFCAQALRLKSDEQTDPDLKADA
ncbi:MAG: DUF2442 domain-containing protein [Jannaschia sp.]